jgi:hypothetical protein
MVVCVPLREKNEMKRPLVTVSESAGITSKPNPSESAFKLLTSVPPGRIRLTIAPAFATVTSNPSESRPSTSTWNGINVEGVIAGANTA